MKQIDNIIHEASSHNLPDMKGVIIRKEALDYEGSIIACNRLLESTHISDKEKDKIAHMKENSLKLRHLSDRQRRWIQRIVNRVRYM